MTRITKDPDVRRREIIDAAMRLFVEKGYEQTSMLDITKSINVSPGLFYRYFKSKEEIYQAALNEYVSQGADQFISMLGNEETSVAELIDTVPAMNPANGDSDPYRQFFNSSGFFHMQMEIALIERLIPIVAKRLESAAARGEIRIDHPLTLASFLMYGQLGVWQARDMEKGEKVRDVRACMKKLLGV